MEEKRIKVTFNNRDHRMDIWMTEQELKKMMTHSDAWEYKADKADLKSLKKQWMRHNISNMICFILQAIAIISLAIECHNLRMMIG